MPKKIKQYKRLPGKQKSFFGDNTLWLGPDHLLSIDSKVYSEDYKRFYYGDIQSIITRKTITGKIQNLVLVLFGGFFILLALSPERMWIWSTFFWVMAGLILFYLLINWLRGPTCVVHLQTAVQTEKLPSLNRIKKTRKAMDLLKPLIERAQGKITSEALAESNQKGVQGIPVPPDVNFASQPLRPEHGRAHKLLFTLLLCDALITSMAFFYTHVAITLVGNAISVGTGVLVIIALVKQHQSDMNGALRALTWITLGYVCLGFVIGYVLYSIIAFKNPDIMNNQWEMIKSISAMSPWDNPFMMSIYIFFICSSLILGISGLILLNKFRTSIYDL